MIVEISYGPDGWRFLGLNEDDGEYIYSCGQTYKITENYWNSRHGNLTEYEPVWTDGAIAQFQYENYLESKDSQPDIRHYLVAIMIGQARIYDMLCLLAKDTAGAEEVDKMIEYHASGKTYMPDPKITFGE